MNFSELQVRGIVIVAACLAAAYLLAAAVVELADQRQRAETAVMRADVAAWQISQLLEEARGITRMAALERKELPHDAG